LNPSNLKNKSGRPLHLAFCIPAFEGRAAGALAGGSIISRHCVRFRKAKAVTWVYSRHGFFASDDDIVRVIGWPARWRQPRLFFSGSGQKPPALFRRFAVFRGRGISPMAIIFYRKKPGRFGIFSPFSGQHISEFLLIPEGRLSQYFYLTPHATSFTWGILDNSMKYKGYLR